MSSVKFSIKKVSENFTLLPPLKTPLKNILKNQYVKNWHTGCIRGVKSKR